MRAMVSLIAVTIALSLLLIYLTLDSKSGANVQASNKPKVIQIQIGKWSCLHQDTEERFPPVRVPAYIPEGFRLVECGYNSTYLELYFLHNSVDPYNIPKDVNAPELISRHTIAFIAMWDGWNDRERTKDEIKITDLGAEYFKEYKANSQRGDLIQIFEINGNPAMGWEVGNKNSIVMLDDKVISSEPLSYPAEIAMIDQKESVYYSARGYVQLEELKKVLESLEKP